MGEAAPSRDGRAEAARLRVRSWLGTPESGGRASFGETVSPVESDGEAEREGDAASSPTSTTERSRIARSMSLLVQLPRWIGIGAETAGAAAEGAGAGAGGEMERRPSASVRPVAVDAAAEKIGTVVAVVSVVPGTPSARLRAHDTTQAAGCQLDPTRAPRQGTGSVIIVCLGTKAIH